MHSYQVMFALIVVIISSAYNLAYAANPSPPVWPNVFQEKFNETSALPVIGTSSNIKGTYFYDFNNKTVRIDRSTGKYDRYCSSVKYFEDTPCSHYVVDGLRYLSFPALSYCCACCTSEEGCGVVKPDWLNNATFVGYNTTGGSVQYQVWSIKGLQENVYWQVNDTQTPYIIDQQPNDKMIFDVTTFKTDPIDPSVFALPSYCSKDKKCPLLSVCTVAR